MPPFPAALENYGTQAEAFVREALTMGGAALAAAPIASLFLSLLLFSFIGWLWESTFCTYVNERRFVNSGFLLGPCCPIYGVGVLSCWLVLRDIGSPVLQFVLAGVLCCVIEYAVGWMLERQTGARFWDYTDLPLNLHGRVCLYGFLLFGTMAVLVCRVVEPWLLWCLALLPGGVVMGAAVILGALLVLDTVSSVASWRHLSERLDLLRNDIAERVDEGMEDLSGKMADRVSESVPPEFARAGAAVQEHAQAVNGWLLNASDTLLETLRARGTMPRLVHDGRRGLRTAVARVRVSLDRRELRFFNAMPRLRLPRYEGIIRATELKEHARELFRR